MTQYPNDPGIDNQTPCDYKPVQEYHILTAENFASAMELQTKYSYECSKQMMEKAVEHTNNMINDIEQMIHKVEENHQKDMQVVRESFDHQNTVLRALKESDDILQAKVECLNTEFRSEITPYERQLILKKIYHLA